MLWFEELESRHACLHMVCVDWQQAVTKSVTDPASDMVSGSLIHAIRKRVSPPEFFRWRESQIPKSLVLIYLPRRREGKAASNLPALGSASLTTGIQ